MQPYQHYTLSERESLAEKIKEGKSMRQIARELGRSPSSVSREIKRNWSQKRNRYSPWGATVKYIQRRKKCVRKPRLADEETRGFVTKGLESYWSPEIISARWAMEHPGVTLCHSTIYRALKRKKLKGFSAKTHLRRHGKRQNHHNSQTIHPEHTIHERPEAAALRQRLGDMEGDTVYGGVGKGCAVTVVDRMSRVLYAALSPSRDSGLIAEAFDEALNGAAVNTLTLDNGSEFAKFPEIEKNLGTTVYFCDKHSPWQRPTNENTNGLLRFFFPKGTDFTAVDRDHFQHVLALINNRPRKCLGWLSPLEFFSAKCCA
jgi:IS30 family transposase